MPYDLVGYNEYLGAQSLVGADDPYGWSEVDSLLSGVDLIGAAARRPNPFGHPVAVAARRPNPFGHPVAVAAQAAAYQHAVQMAAAAKQAHNGVIVREQQATKARRLVLGLVSNGAVVAGAAATITARPQTIAFKPDRLVIPGSIGPDFILTDIKVGNVSQLVQSGELSAETFGPLVTESLVDFDTVQTSQDFVLQVQNISGANRTFRATVYGKSIQP